MKKPAGCQSLFAFEQAVVDAARASAHAKLQANLAAKAQRAILKRQAELDKANRRFKRDEKRKGKTPNEYAQCGIRLVLPRSSQRRFRQQSIFQSGM